jgi:hypothetical protein
VEEYLDDLHQVVRSQRVRIAVYERRGGCLAAALAVNEIPIEHRGVDALPWVLVVFSADRGTIVSGYQTSTDLLTNIPGDALWLT